MRPTSYIYICTKIQNVKINRNKQIKIEIKTKTYKFWKVYIWKWFDVLRPTSYIQYKIQLN